MVVGDIVPRAALASDIETSRRGMAVSSCLRLERCANERAEFTTSDATLNHVDVPHVTNRWGEETREKTRCSSRILKDDVLQNFSITKQRLATDASKYSQEPPGRPWHDFSRVEACDLRSEEFSLLRESRICVVARRAERLLPRSLGAGRRLGSPRPSASPSSTESEVSA